MGYQDFLQNYKQKRQQEPIELPEYDPLPTQVDQIFGKPRPTDKTVQAETNTSAPLEKPKKKGDVLDTKLGENAPFETLRDVKDWTPDKPIQDLKQLGSALKVRRQLYQPQPQKKRTVAAKSAPKAIPYTPQTGKNNDQSEFLNQMDFRGPTDADRMMSNVREGMGLQPSVPESRRKGFLDKYLQEEAQRSYQKSQGVLEDIEANTQTAKAEQRLSQPQSTIQTAKGADSSKSSLSAVTGQKERETKARLRTKRVDEIRKLSGGSLNPVNRMVGRGLGLVSGYAPDEIAEALPPIGRIENAGSHFAGAAIRGASSIPEGVARFLEQNLVNRDAVQTYELMNQFADAEDKRAASEGRASKGDEYRKIAQGSLESQMHVGDYLEPLTKAGEKFSQAVLPTDPTVEGSINPLKRGFWESILPEAAGSMAPFFAGGAAGAAVKIPRMLSAGVLGAGMEIPQGYHEARDAGATPEQLSKTTDIRTAAGMLEMFGAESLLGKIGMKGKSIPGYLAKEALQEGVQEAGQSLTEDVGDKYYAGTKPNLAWSQIGHNALENAVPALFLGVGGGAMGVPAHLAERKANSAQVAEQIESLANAQPGHPVVQAIASLGIDPGTITQADDRAVDELSTRLQSMAKMDSQIQQMQGQREVLAQQAQNAYDAQLMGRVPSSVDMQAAQQLPMVDQAVAELTQQKEAVTQDLTQNVSPLFRNLAKAVGNKQVEPLADAADDQQGDLLKEVRKAGGVAAPEGAVEAGELERLSPKEIGSTGLISRKGGESPDQMRERMVSEGLSNAETPHQLIEEVESAAIRKKNQKESESFEDYHRGQMSAEEQAQSDKLDEVLADKAHPFTQVYRQLDNPKGIYTSKLAKQFVEEADKLGFSDDFIERSLVEFQQQRGIASNGTNRVVDEPGRSMAKPSKPAEPGVSMSPYKVLEANNKDLLKRLYDVNLNSEEGKAGIQELRDYARKNGIEQRHVNAHISDIQNWQKTYGVPKLDQPRKVQPARPKQPESGFSLDQKKLLGREPAELADDEFDEHLEAVEKLHADAVHGKVNLNEGQMNAVVKKIRQIKGERHQRVRAGRLKSLYGKKEGKQPSKAEISAAVEKAIEKKRETESVPRETENVSQGTKEKKETVGKSQVDQNPTVSKPEIDSAAHEAATSPKNELAEPTEGQKEAGNYQKGHIKLHGMDITIENPEGSTRSGKDADGKPWEVEMSAHYGYIRRTEGADEEQIDVYIGPKTDSNEVFVVDQVDAETGEFDEHKVILGAETQAEAEKLYDDHFDDGKGPDRRGAITQMPVDEFKDWLKNEDTTTPVGDTSEAKNENASELIPLPKVGDQRKLDGVPHTLDRIQRIGELDFELWQSNEDSGMTMVTRDAETGDALPGSTISDTNSDRAKRRYRTKTEEAKFGQKETSKSATERQRGKSAVAEELAGVGQTEERDALSESAPVSETKGGQDERFVDDGRLSESGPADKSGTSKPVAAKSEGQPQGQSRPGSVASKPAKSGKRRGLGKQTEPSLFGNESEQTTESSDSAHAQELVREVAQETEPIAAGEAVTQAAVADLPEVAETETVQPEEPQPKPVKTPKPKAQPLATLTSASFTITPDIVDQIRSGGAVAKYKQNVDAIKTMRQVLMEGRRPTVEEQETMALYAGFGGIKDLFAATGNTYQERQKWWDRQQELKELIGEEAYKAASASTKNAHYTDPHIVTAMWSMAERLGFTKGRVLEPSMGSGNFLGLIPSHLRDKTTFTGVELDNTTGNIAKMLYPDANVHIQGFEDLKAPDGFFDLAIGNVPFGEYRISDNRYNKLLPQIHNYFFLKALDKVRPGGLVMFITNTGTMDSRRGEDIRKELAKQADLVSAMRFPAETFGKTALTSVVTDLIIFRKRLPGEVSKSDAWMKSSEVADPRGAGYQKIKLNNYFAENPSQILGEFNGNNRMYPGRANVDRTEDFEQRLAEAMANLPAGVMSDYSTVRQPRMKEVGMKAKEGGYIVKDGQLLQNVSGGLAEIDATPDRINRVDGMLKIRDAFDNLIDAEMGRAIGGPAQRKALNSAYDAFNAKYGAISDKKNREALEGDPDLYRLMALEDYDAKKKIAKKQPIFTKSTVSGIRADAKPSNVVEAVAKSFQMNGEIILPQLAEDLGLDERTIGEELVAKKIAFQTPNGNWELAARYLSGNVRRKLGEAKIAAATDDFFQANVDALEQLLPRDVRSDEISVEMGAPWMEPQVISQFVAELFEDQPSNVGVAYDRHLGTFTLSLDRSRARGSRLAMTTWGTADLPFDKLLNLALTGKQASVFDEVKTNNGTERRFNAEKTQAANTKLDAIKQRFREWVWGDDNRKQRLLARYNDLFNSNVPAEYNVEFLLDEKGEGVVPGLSSGWKLRKHQAAAVFRAVIEKRGLLAHEVGLGKTLAMIASASELKRLGIARKPAIAVPKKVLPGFLSAARSAFPLMKIHVIDSRDAAKRNTSMSQVATGEHDLVLMTHDNMDMLKMKPEFEAEILRGELDEVTAVYNAMRGEKTSDKRLLKQIENRKSKLEAKLQDALKAERKDDTISFEDTGIDFLFVDEFHKYKSLPVVTALGQVKGVPTGDSQRAINMLMRARYLQQIQNGGGLIAATGTPVSNSLVEAWIMAKFLQPDLLEEAGVQSFDAWTRQFAETVPALEMGATGEWKQVSRLSKFKNLPELQTLARMTLDVKTAKETGILDVRPKRQDKVIQVPQDEAQAAFMQVLRERAAAVKSRLVEPYEDNYLVISSDGMQMASDPRLVLPGYKAEGGKIKALADSVLRIYKEKPGTTQMIFSDSGVAPNAWGFHLYGEIINKLVEGGIPADKIINFSKMDTDAKVAKAQDRLNSGDAVIAIGHRENMGTGINAQQKMAAIHQFDVPWKPALVEQSEARGWRQGNENKEIEILSYVTEGSFDAIKWSTVARKQQAITAFMQKPQEGQSRELEDADDDALSYDQIAAAASGDGDYLRKAELDAKVFKLDMMERSHNSEALNRKQEIPRIVDRIAAMNRRATRLDLVAAAAKEVKEKDFEYKTPKGEVVEDKKDAAKNLVSNYLYEKDRKERTVIGQYKGYWLMSDGYGSVYMDLPIKGAEPERFGFNVNTTEFIGTLQSLEKKIAAFASNADADHLRETTIPNLEKDLENLRAVTDSPFPFTEQLTKAKRQLGVVNKRLKAKEAESASEGQPLSAGETDVRAVSALGRKIRHGMREKEIKPSDIPRILEEALPAIEAQLRDQKDVWREFQHRKAEDFLAEHEGDTGLAGMAITAQSASRAQAAYDPEIDAAESRPMASRRTRESVESSPEFEKWFGESKVVDQSGKPLPLYHGTQARNEIEAIDPSRFLSGSHFGPGFYMAEEPEIASRGYAEGHLHPRGQEQSGSPSVYKLYARIENPLDMSKPADSKMIAAVFGSPNVDLEEMGFGSRPTNEVLYKQLAKRLGDDKRAANERLQELGFDGITRLNRASDEAPEHREWVVFDPRQVKSATGNQGTFDDSANLSTSRRQVSGPASELANPMDVLLHAETITKSRGSRGVRMYVNDHARALLGASLTEVFGEDYSNVNAINLSREEISKVADYLEGEAKGLTGDYQAGATQFVQELRDMLVQGGSKQKTFNIVDITPFEQRYSTGFRPDAERAVETFKGDVREESFHWSQREVGGVAIASVGSSWAQSSKGYGKYRKALLKLGYPDDPEVIAAETAAKIAAGKFDDLGIRTEADHQQADEWLASYFERIADKHGVEALTKFDRLLPKATEAKQKGELSAKERLRQAIKEEAATATGQRANRPEASGGSSQTVRSGNQEEREEGSAEPIPRRSPEEPFNSASSEDLNQASLFDEKGMPKKEWGDIWKTLADILNIPKALRASGDLSAGGRQGWFLSIPPSRWGIAAKSFGKSLQASEAFGLKKGADKRLHAEMKQRPAYRDAVAAGLAVHSNDPLSVQTELFGSRFAGKIPWAKYSEQAYKTHLDWLSLMTFEVYKKSIDKQIKDPKERFEAYQAAADWINTSSGRGSYRGKFGAWYQKKAAPLLNVIGWAPGLVYSRFQLLNPYTYAQNLKNPGHRVVFRKQMSEVFQSAAVLYLTAVLAKAGGALVSTDPDEADFLKLRFGTTRYDVLAGLQQVARLSLRIGDYLRIKATTDTSTEEGQKKVRKASGEASQLLGRFGRTKLGPVPGLVVDWWNDWVKVTGERHAPGDFITSFKEGNKVKGVADLAEDPIISQALPLFWADMVAAYEQGWRANGNQGGLEHLAKVLPAGLGIGVQDYDRPEWKKETRKQLDRFDLDPQFPKHKTGEKEEAYQKRVKEHIADQEAAINRFSSSESVKDQPLTRQKELLKQEMSEDGRNRLEKLRPDDIEDDRAVRAWILLGRERLKNDENYKSADEETQKKILQSYYSRMNPYKAQPANNKHEYQRPDFVDEDVLKQKIREAIKAQQ